jgi:hypothetical protein
MGEEYARCLGFYMIQYVQSTHSEVASYHLRKIRCSVL